MAGGLSRTVAPGDRGVCVTPVTPRFAWPPSCPGFSSSPISLPGERRCQGVVWSTGVLLPLLLFSAQTPASLDAQK